MPTPHAILVAIGSAGDVNPFVGLGRALRQRGYRVTVAVNPFYEDAVRDAGLDPAPIGTAEEFLAVTRDRAIWRGVRGMRRLVSQVVSRLVRDTYRVVAERHEPGNTVVAASSLALGARIAQDALGVPLASVHLQPVVFRSHSDPSVTPGPPLHKAPVWLRRAAFGVADFGIDRLLGPEVNGLRRELGLPPVKGILNDWWHSPQRILALFPDWFAPPQADWPPQARAVGFPLFDDAAGGGLSREALAFLEAGTAPVVFTPGSANRHAAAFFRAAVEACGRLGRRGILLTRFREQLPRALPPSVAHYDYLPLSRLLPHAAAICHHGGIGTMSQGFAAGIPQVVMPMSYDQLDNAARASRLGVARAVPPRAFGGATLAGALHALLNSERVAADCREVNVRVARQGGLAQAADEIGVLLAPAARPLSRDRGGAAIPP